MSKQSPADSQSLNARTPVAPGRPKMSVTTDDLERLVSMDFIRATEAAALSAQKWVGKGNKEAGDYAACDAIRGLFDSVNMCGENAAL